MQRDLLGPHLIGVRRSEMRKRNREQKQHHRAHQPRGRRAIPLPEFNEDRNRRQCCEADSDEQQCGEMQRRPPRHQVSDVQNDGAGAENVTANPNCPVVRFQRDMKQHGRQQAEHRKTCRDNDVRRHPAPRSSSQSNQGTDIPQERETGSQNRQHRPLLRPAPPVRQKEIQQHAKDDRAAAVPDGIYQGGFVDAEPIRHADLTISDSASSAYCAHPFVTDHIWSTGSFRPEPTLRPETATQRNWMNTSNL
jgi:hypothetical protein